MDDPELDTGEVTRLLQAAQGGEPDALERLLPLVYDDLRQLGRPAMAARDRAHFLAIAARAMRQVLVDHARDRKAAKRGGGEWERTTLTDGAWAGEFDPDGVLALDEALGRLEPRQRQVVECRFFGGMEEQEIASALGVSERTVHRDWIKARAWLYRYFYPEGDGPASSP